jgi:fluoroquinolone transport system permease protein
MALGSADIKNIRRDALLAWVPLITFSMALAIRLLVPQVAELLRQNIHFNLTLYYPLIMSCFALLTPSMVGMVIGFLLLDERDDRTLTALLVTPLRLPVYLLYRISVPLLLAIILTLICYPLAGLTPMSLPNLFPIVLLGSLISPMMALFLAAFAANKVAGFAMLKLLNAVLILPVAAFFLPANVQWLVGIIPPFWPLKAFWLLVASQSDAFVLVIGLLVNLVALLLLLKRFTVVVHR